MSYELIVTEKPRASERIASALADTKPIKKSLNQVPYYEIKHKGKNIVIGCAVGHLYTLAEKKKSWQYPVFDIEWKPTSSISKGAVYTKKYLNVLKKLSKEANEFTIATDYDIEGEVIGLNIIRYVCNQKDAERMKFSTLTKPDLIKAYENKSKQLDWGQANAGLTRHELDWYYGINLSRALTDSIKSIGSFKIMSSGRVQGPALKIIVDREKEIRSFKPEPFWIVSLNGNVKNGKIEAWHEKDKFWKKEEADKVIKNTKDKQALIKEIDTKRFEQSPPVPFDLTTLQTESYRCFRISPKETLAIAQELYINGWISYPRTSSQKLPKEIDYKKIIESLREYSKLAELLLKKNIRPNEGKKTDPAHPAIYPTGIIPSVSGRESKVYDLIVKRFMATFADSAIRETNTIKIDCNKEIFIAKGTVTKEKGWHIFYEPYVKLEEEDLPKTEKDEEVKNPKIKMHDKETQPTKRYTPASIIKELEKKNLGTKSTRAQIVDTLFQRDYIKGTPIKATDIGIKTVETLEKYSPTILDEKLTRHFEEEMEEIREKKITNEKVLEEAKKILKKILKEFKEKEKMIGKALLEAERETLLKEKTVGKCKCGGNLLIRKGKFGRFIACDKFPKCTITFKLPVAGKVITSDKICSFCSHPMIQIIKKRGKQEICINKNCPSKQIKGEEGKEEKELKNGDIEKECPKCKKKLVLRKSIYGEFLGCSGFPKCRYTEKIKDGPLKEDF